MMTLSNFAPGKSVTIPPDFYSSHGMKSNKKTATVLRLVPEVIGGNRLYFVVFKEAPTSKYNVDFLWEGKRANSREEPPYC